MQNNRQTFFGVAVYDLWNDTNDLIFSRNTILSRELLYKVANQASFISKEIADPVTSKSHTQKEVVQVKWSYPLLGWHKINIDGTHPYMFTRKFCLWRVGNRLSKFVY